MRPEIQVCCSWNWRKLLQLRTNARPFISMIVGTGEDIFSSFGMIIGPIWVLLEYIGLMELTPYHPSDHMQSLSFIFIMGEWQWH